MVVLVLTGCSKIQDGTVTNYVPNNMADDRLNSDSKDTTPAGEIYQTLICGFSDSVLVNDWEIEYEFADREKFSDQPEEEIVELSINGMNVIGKYYETSYRGDNFYPSYYYKTENGFEFAIDESGLLDLCFWGDSSVQDAKMTEAECVDIARNFLANIINVDDYRIEVEEDPLGDEMYCVEFVKFVNGFRTADMATVTVKKDGTLYSYSGFMLGRVKRESISINNVDIEKIKKSAIDRVSSKYQSIESLFSRIDYEILYTELTVLKDGKIGFYFAIDGRCIQTFDEGETAISERHLVLVIIDD